MRDLFFNTLARRKFLRSEKTEFGHLEAVVRKIALSRFDVMLSEDTHTDESALEALVEDLRGWVELLELPRLSAYGVTEADLPRIAAASRGSSMKTNPLVVSDEELIEILRRRL